jgi:hypothetical protein
VRFSTRRHTSTTTPCIGSRPLRGRGGAVVAGANSCWLWHPRLAVGSQQRSEGPFPVRRPDGLCADATDGTGPFDRTLGVGRRGEFAGTEKRDFSRRIRRPAGTTQWEVTYNRHCHRHSLGKWFTMRCSKAMTSSNAARRYTEPMTEPVGRRRPADPQRPDRPRDANSSHGTRARFRRFNYDNFL